MPATDFRLVLIKWVDSYGSSSTWAYLEGYNPAPMLCRSVGWLIHDGEDCKVVVFHLSQHSQPNAGQQGCGDMTIPTLAVLTVADVGIVKRSTKRGKS